ADPIKPLIACRGKWLEDAVVAHAKDRNIGRLRQFRDGAVASATQYGRIVRVDRKYRPGKPDPVQRGDQPSSDRRLFRRAEDSDRSRLEERFKPHRFLSMILTPMFTRCGTPCPAEQYGTIARLVAPGNQW